MAKGFKNMILGILKHDQELKKEATQCQGCDKEFIDSDAKDFENFCSAPCESEHRVNLAEYRKETNLKKEKE